MVLEMQRQMEDDKMQKALAAERKKAAYLEKQKAKVQEYQAKKAQEEQEKRLKADKEKDMATSQRKKFLKEQESKKKQIADYKRKKMEAEEMLANADLPFEDFYPGPDIVWTLSHDEVHYVTKGRAEMTYHLPPLMKETGTVIAEAGSVYLLPRGCRVVWRVLGGEPFRHLCICIPNTNYPSRTAPSVAKRA